MKKIEIKQMENLEGGTARLCFLVGALGGFGYMGGPGWGAISGNLISYCWNS